AAESIIGDLARLRATARVEVPEPPSTTETVTDQPQQGAIITVEKPHPEEKDVVEDPVEMMLSRAREALMADKLERKIDR
ncbi:hypothetical protein Pmar_PMAR015724, partial [Perkinsus marinus ATCC 50983]